MLIAELEVVTSEDELEELLKILWSRLAELLAPATMHLCSVS